MTTLVADARPAAGGALERHRRADAEAARLVVIGGSLMLAVLTRLVQPPLLVLVHRTFDRFVPPLSVRPPLADLRRYAAEVRRREVEQRTEWDDAGSGSPSGWLV